MIVSESQIRVRYGETDQMGYMYYGNYPQYFEVGRTDLLRQFGLDYRSMEEKGIMLPVYDLQIRYLRPALYDDLLTVKTCLNKLPTTRLDFDYEVFNDKGILLTTGSTTLVYVDKATRRPTKAPGYFLDKIEVYFEKK